MAPSGDAAGVGSRVKFRDEASGDEKEITLVHRLEASMAEGKLSAESPVGRALMGAAAGRQGHLRDSERPKESDDSYRRLIKRKSSRPGHGAGAEQQRSR